MSIPPVVCVHCGCSDIYELGEVTVDANRDASIEIRPDGSYGIMANGPWDYDISSHSAVEPIAFCCMGCELQFTDHELSTHFRPALRERDDVILKADGQRYFVERVARDLRGQHVIHLEGLGEPVLWEDIEIPVPNPNQMHLYAEAMETQ